jgi:pimeloyl-ACP methyl ester carboxylesterase
VLRGEGIEKMVGLASSTGVGSFLDVDGIKTFFVEQGDGEAVVLVHGAAPGASAQVSWQPNLDPLAKAGFWVIAYDQPGFGQSGPPEENSLEYRVQHARAFIDALGLTHYHLIGSSDGAYVAARLALEDPRVDRLVLVSGSALAPSGSEGAASPQRPILGELPKLSPRTLILWGKNDQAAVDRALQVFNLIPGAELHVFDECGHWVQSDQAARFNQIVSAFLQAGS